MLSTLYVRNAKNHFWEIAITNERVWLTVKPITTNFLATCVTFVIKSFKGMCSQHSTKLGMCTYLFTFKVLKFDSIICHFYLFFRCVNHFACSSCDQKMTVKTKFYEVDLKPVCKVSD